MYITNVSSFYFLLIKTSTLLPGPASAASASTAVAVGRTAWKHHRNPRIAIPYRVIVVTEQIRHAAAFGGVDLQSSLFYFLQKLSLRK
jgi:hypothetical protein